jgi:hypothetical protein
MVIFVGAAALPSAPVRRIFIVIDDTMNRRGELCAYDREEEQPVWRTQRHYDYYFYYCYYY